MAKAIESGVPKRRIEEAAARTQARIDSGRQTVIGVNAYAPTIERDLSVLKVDAAAVRARQIEKLGRLRAERDERSTQAALEALTNGARGRANLLQLSVEAARAKATVGEISLALEKAFGRHVAEVRAISGVYLSEAGPGGEANERVIAMTRAFTENEGRAPRILVAKMGQDGHDRGQKIIASAFADLGFDVEIGPLFATPEEVAALAAKRAGPHRRRLVARRRPPRARAGSEEGARQARSWTKRWSPSAASSRARTSRCCARPAPTRFFRRAPSLPRLRKVSWSSSTNDTDTASARPHRKGGRRDPFARGRANPTNSPILVRAPRARPSITLG